MESIVWAVVVGIIFLASIYADYLRCKSRVHLSATIKQQADIFEQQLDFLQKRIEELGRRINN